MSSIICGAAGTKVVQSGVSTQGSWARMKRRLISHYRAIASMLKQKRVQARQLRVSSTEREILYRKMEASQQRLLKENDAQSGLGRMRKFINHSRESRVRKFGTVGNSYTFRYPRLPLLLV